MSEEKHDWTKQDVLADLERILAHGFGSLTIEINEHKIEQLDVLIRKRKARRAGK